MECGGRHRAPGLRIKTEDKGFAHQNGEQRVCGEPSANRAGAAAGKKGNPGSGFAHQNGEQRVCGESSANRAGEKKAAAFR